MDFLNIVYANIKIILKDKKTLAILLIFPLFMALVVFAMSKFGSNTNNTKDVAFYTEGKIEGKLKGLFDTIESNEIHTKDKENLLKQVKEYKIAKLYVIPSNFNESLRNGEKPIITAYEVRSGNSNILIDKKINDFIYKELEAKYLEEYSKNTPNIKNLKEDNSLIKNEVVKDKNSVDELILVSLAIAFYLLTMTISPTALNIIKFRKEKIFERQATTKFSPFKILLALFMAYAILEVVIYSILIFILTKVGDFNSNNLGIIIFYILLIVVLNISIAILIARVGSNETLIPAFGNILGMVEFFLIFGYLIPFKNDSIKQILLVANKLNPLYWAIDGIKNIRLFPNTLVLVLMLLVLITSGSFRFNKFVRE